MLVCVIAVAVGLVVAGVAGPHGAKTYRDCATYVDKFVPHSLKCFDASRDLVAIQDAGVDFAGFMEAPEIHGN